MAVPSVPTGFYVSQGNRETFLGWDLTPTATSYQIQRSTDGVNYSNLATSTTNSYTDVAVTIGNLYYYQVAGINLSGTGAFTAPLSITPAPTAEMSLGELRLRAQERADRVNSQFVTTPEWNFFINQSLYELYDLLIDVYNDYFMAPYASFLTNTTQFQFPLPDGNTLFLDQSGNSFKAAPFYKLLGVDLALNTSANGYVTVNKFMWADRNTFVYPNTASTIYGVFNLQYRLMGSNINFIPTPSANQLIRLSYIPRLPQLLADTDLTNLGFSGWLQYAIIRAAKYALDKEESDTSKLDAELLYLKQRIEESAINRDADQPDRITNIRQNGSWNAYNGGLGWGSGVGGW